MHFTVTTDRHFDATFFLTDIVAQLKNASSKCRLHLSIMRAETGLLDFRFRCVSQKAKVARAIIVQLFKTVFFQ